MTAVAEIETPDLTDSSEKYVIEILGLAGQAQFIIGVKRDERQFLATFDPDWQPDNYSGDKSGLVSSTNNPREAMTFNSTMEAYTLYQTQSTTTPYRPDGKPNRPLSAFDIEIMPLSEAIGKE